MGAGASLISTYSDFRISKCEIPHIGILDSELKPQMNDLLYYKDGDDKIPVGALFTILDSFKTDIFLLHAWADELSGATTSTTSILSSEDKKQKKRDDQLVNRIHSYLIGKGVTVANNYSSVVDTNNTTTSIATTTTTSSLSSSQEGQIRKNSLQDFNLSKSRLVIIFISKQQQNSKSLISPSDSYFQCLGTSFKIKSRNFLFPVILDTFSREPDNWDPLVSKQLGSSMYFDMTDDCSNKVLDTFYGQVMQRIKFPMAKISNDVLQHIMTTVSAASACESPKSPSKNSNNSNNSSPKNNSSRFNQQQFDLVETSSSSSSNSRLHSKSEEKRDSGDEEEQYRQRLSPSKKPSQRNFSLSEIDTCDTYYKAFNCAEASQTFASEVSRGHNVHAELLAIAVYIFGTEFIKPNKAFASDLCSKHRSILEESFITCNKNISFARGVYYDKIVQDPDAAKKWYNLAAQQGFRNHFKTNTL